MWVCENTKSKDANNNITPALTINVGSSAARLRPTAVIDFANRNREVYDLVMLMLAQRSRYVTQRYLTLGEDEWNEFS